MHTHRSCDKAKLFLANGVLFALLSASGWAIVDTVSKIVVNKTGYFRLMFFLDVLGLLPLFVYAIFFTVFPHLSIESVLTTALIAVFLTVIGGMMYFKGIEKGKVSLVSPLSSAWGIVTTVLALAFLHEVLNINQGISIVLIFLGIVLASESWSAMKGVRSSNIALRAREGLAAMISWGLAFFS